MRDKVIFTARRTGFIMTLALAGCAQPMIYDPPAPVPLAKDAAIGPREVDALPHSAPSAIVRYGPDARQFAELRLPAGRGPFPVAMIVHGGCYTKGFATQVNLAPLASRLAEHGIATYNIDYRELGDVSVGWPAMPQDWAAAAAKLRTIASTHRLDMTRAFIIGHSAGASAAFWLANGGGGIDGIAPAGLPKFRRAVLLDGVPDLASFEKIDVMVCGKPVTLSLMGGSAADHPDRYALLSPSRTKVKVPTLLFAGQMDLQLMPSQVGEAEKRSGGLMTVVRDPKAGHFDMIAPGTDVYATFEPRLVAFLKAK